MIPVKLDGDIACNDGVTHAISGVRHEMASGLNTESEFFPYLNPVLSLK